MRRGRALGRKALAYLGYEVRGVLPTYAAHVPQDFILEEHHHAYGRPWCLGRDQFEYLVTRGVVEGNRVLDLGCGVLRLGVWLIPRVGEDCYYGIEAHRRSLEVVVEYEVPLHGLEAYRPRLLLDENFSAAHFGVSFDWIISFSTLIHLDDAQRTRCLENVVPTLAAGGRLVLSHRLPFPEAELEQRFGLEVVHQARQECRLLDDHIDWFELQAL